MKLKSFLKLVEIRTKVASINPLLFGTLYAYYEYHSFKVLNFLIMLISLLAIDMATTTLNNYFDYKKANKTHGYNYESHNAIVGDKLEERKVLAVIFSLLLIAAVFGVMLFFNTNIIVLILGAVSFTIGVMYSFGPIPISRTPFGEMFSGFFMGFVIMFLSVFIHIYDKDVASIALLNGVLDIRLNIIKVLYLFMVSIPFISGIANIMLANNICDIEDDIENKRYTMPIFVGRPKALMIFKWLYFIAYADIAILIILRVLPAISVITLLTFIPVNKNIKVFFNKQSKAETFALSVKNFIQVSSVYILSIVLAIIIRYLMQ